jgi:hypothetical protein
VRSDSRNRHQTADSPKVRTHKKKMQGNTPEALPMIIRPNIIEQLTKPTVLLTKRLRIMASHTKQAKAGNVVTPRQSTHLRGLEPSAHVDSATQE